MRNNRGIALVLTLWILAALIVLAAGMAVMARTEAQISRNHADIIRCRWLAHAGINRGIIEVESLAAEQCTFFQEMTLNLTSGDEMIDLGSGEFDVDIEDEAGKININTASVEVLEALFGSREIAENIVQWRGREGQPGATSTTSAQQSSYASKNAPFDTVRELLLVAGVTEGLLSSQVTSDGSALADLLTVYSCDQNLTVEGEKRLNIQTADKEQLKTTFGDVLSEQEIDAIIKHRDEKKFESTGEIIDIPNLAREKVSRIFDHISVSEDETRPGLVNINTASAEVLAALPGLDRTVADEVIAHRTAHGEFADVGRLLDLPGVTAEVFAKCADFLTVRSRIFTIRSTGRLARARSSREIICVADATGGKTAQIRYWRE